MFSHHFRIIIFFDNNFKSAVAGGHPYMTSLIFLKIFDPSLILVTHFTKWAYGVTSTFSRSPLPFKWLTSFIDSPQHIFLKFFSEYKQTEEGVLRPYVILRCQNMLCEISARFSKGTEFLSDLYQGLAKNPCQLSFLALLGPGSIPLNSS